jgi:DNA-binding transcriptional regulator YdaS (Cro superfamily)
MTYIAKTPDKGLQHAIKTAGGVRRLAELLGTSHVAILSWGRIPSHRIIQIERVTGIPREELRPDLYR